MRLEPLTLRQANDFVEQHHRHHGITVGMKFAIGAGVDGVLVGVAIVGRPVSRVIDDGWVLEVLRCCTDGTRNACSFLYGAAWKATRALGFRKLVTYTLKSESGASLRAVGWSVVGEVNGRSWSCPSRPREDKSSAQLEFKLRWEKEESK